MCDNYTYETALPHGTMNPYFREMQVRAEQVRK